MLNQIFYDKLLLQTGVQWDVRRRKPSPGRYHMIVSNLAYLQPCVCRCRRLYQIGSRDEVLQSIEPPGLQISVSTWTDSDSAQKFLNRCSDAGNAHASYMLGMVSYPWGGGGDIKALSIYGIQHYLPYKDGNCLCSPRTKFI